MKHDEKSLFFEHHLDLEKRIIFLLPSPSESDPDSELDSRASRYVLRGLYLMKKINKESIKIIMNSGGGDVVHAFAIYDAIKGLGVPVDIELFGHAESASVITFQAARHRYIHKNSTIMVHDGLVELPQTKSRDVDAFNKWSKQMDYKMWRVFAERTGRRIKYWEKKCSNDYYLTAEDAIKEKLADEIIEIAFF